MRGTGGEEAAVNDTIQFLIILVIVIISGRAAGTLEAKGVEHFAEAAPLGRIGDDQDLKGAALLFASDAGKHITGQILAVDGGVSAT